METMKLFENCQTTKNLSYTLNDKGILLSLDSNLCIPETKDEVLKRIDILKNKGIDGENVFKVLKSSSFKQDGYFLYFFDEDMWRDMNKKSNKNTPIDLSYVQVLSRYEKNEQMETKVIKIPLRKISSIWEDNSFSSDCFSHKIKIDNNIYGVKEDDAEMLGKITNTPVIGKNYDMFKKKEEQRKKKISNDNEQYSIGGEYLTKQEIEEELLGSMDKVSAETLISSGMFTIAVLMDLLKYKGLNTEEEVANAIKEGSLASTFIELFEKLKLKEEHPEEEPKEELKEEITIEPETFSDKEEESEEEGSSEDDEDDYKEEEREEYDEFEKSSMIDPEEMGIIEDDDIEE